MPAIASPRERAARLFFSDRRLVTQDGHDVAFYTDVLKNNVVLINFFFTQCTDSCPTQSARLEEVQTLLRANPRPRVRLVSVSVDPAHDSPAALAAYAATWHAGNDWTFLTGSPQIVNDVLRRLGQLVAERRAHTSMFIAGNGALAEAPSRYAVRDDCRRASSAGRRIADPRGSTRGAVALRCAP